MVRIAAGLNDTAIHIFGCGLSVHEGFQISSGVTLSSDVPDVDLEKVASGSRGFADYAAAVVGREIASFTINVEQTDGPQSLVTQAWNSLWLFHLFSITFRSPVLPLFSSSVGGSVRFGAANPAIFLKTPPDPVKTSMNQLNWARLHLDAFDKLIKIPEFSSATLCLGNAPYLTDPRTKIMLIWSGIEGLLSVDSELSRRIALYCAMLYKGNSEEKMSYFKAVKKAYGLRSRAVHGSKTEKNELQAGYLVDRT